VPSKAGDCAQSWLIYCIIYILFYIFKGWKCAATWFNFTAYIFGRKFPQRTICKILIKPLDCIKWPFLQYVVKIKWDAEKSVSINLGFWSLVVTRLVCVAYLQVTIWSACSSPYGGGFSWSALAGRVLLSIVLHDSLKAFRMLQKSCLGKASGKPWSARSGIHTWEGAVPDRNRHSLPKTQTSPKAPGPTLRYKGSVRRCRSQAVPCRPNWEIYLLGGEEHAAKGKECTYCLCNNMQAILLCSEPFLPPWCRAERVQLLSKGALESFWESTAAGRSCSCCCVTYPCHPAVRLPGRAQRSAALPSSSAGVCS